MKKKYKYAQTKEELVLSLINRQTPRAYSWKEHSCTYNRDIHNGCAIGSQISKALSINLSLNIK